MQFVTTKREGYSFFATTPSGRAAVGLTGDQKRLHWLVRSGTTWETLRDWPVEEFSHTDLLLRLGAVDEPTDPTEILRHLPGVRDLH